jgi:hypothetical protein
MREKEPEKERMKINAGIPNQFVIMYDQIGKPEDEVVKETIIDFILEHGGILNLSTIASSIFFESSKDLDYWLSNSISELKDMNRVIITFDKNKNSNVFEKSNFRLNKNFQDMVEKVKLRRQSKKSK